MRFDDRLSTVLGLSAEAPRDRAVQWRQLVELVARGGGGGDPALLAKALVRIAELRPELPEAVRASAARAIAGLPVPTALLAIFAGDRPEVIAPLLRSADLDTAGWSEVRAQASPDVRALIDSILPQSEIALEDRPNRTAPLAAPRPAAAGTPGLFRWECGPAGEIDWVEGVPRAALVGFSLSREVAMPFAAKLPFEEELVTPAEAGAAAGPWLLSGQPRFHSGTGRFAGYSGLARREGAPPLAEASAAAEPAPLTGLDSDALRELIHELRTPLTAIIGFGEIIEGQFLGPAHRAYRDRAGEIVRQARRLLGAVEELDLAAKLGSGATRGPGTLVTTIVRSLEAEIGERMSARGSALRVDVRAEKDRYAMDGALAERLVRRFVQAIADAAQDGERLELIVDRIGAQIALSLGRPRVAAGLSEEELFDGGGVGSGSVELGLGFTLRLVRGLARIAGGGLDVGTDRFVLLLPAAKAGGA